MGCCPVGQFVSDALHFVADLLHAVDRSVRVLLDEPTPERGTEVESVMEVLRADEDIGVQQVGHQTLIPRLALITRKVCIFFTPRSRNASVNDERPSHVLMTSARANRLLTRADCVR